MEKTFHHIGIPTSAVQPNEIYLADVKLNITDASKNEHNIEYLRFEPGSSLPDILKKSAHIAYAVDNLDKALAGKKVIVPPWRPMEGVRVAFIQDGDTPVEYLQFSK